MTLIIDFYSDQDAIGSIEIKDNVLSVLKENLTPGFSRFIAGLIPSRHMDWSEWAESLPFIVHGRTYAVKRENNAEAT
jgi:hypothetical protein